MQSQDALNGSKKTRENRKEEVRYLLGRDQGKESFLSLCTVVPSFSRMPMTLVNFPFAIPRMGFSWA